MISGSALMVAVIAVCAGIATATAEDMICGLSALSATLLSIGLLAAWSIL